MNLKKRGNPYLCADKIKKELLYAQDEADAVKSGNVNFKTSCTKPNQRQEFLSKKWAQMRRLDKGQIELLDYMKSIGYMTMSKDQRFSDAAHDMNFEEKSDSISSDEILDYTLPDVDETETSPIITKAPKGKDLQQKRKENMSVSFASDSLPVIHEFLFQKYLQSESLVILDSEEKMHMDEADAVVDERLLEKNCVLSKEKTPAEGQNIIQHYPKLLCKSHIYNYVYSCEFCD